MIEQSEFESYFVVGLRQLAGRPVAEIRHCALSDMEAGLLEKGSSVSSLFRFRVPPEQSVAFGSSG
jgi:hypothetical protein